MRDGTTGTQRRITRDGRCTQTQCVGVGDDDVFGSETQRTTKIIASIGQRYGLPGGSDGAGTAHQYSTHLTQTAIGTHRSSTGDVAGVEYQGCRITQRHIAATNADSTSEMIAGIGQRDIVTDRCEGGVAGNGQRASLRQRSAGIKRDIAAGDPGTELQGTAVSQADVAATGRYCADKKIPCISEQQGLCATGQRGGATDAQRSTLS